MATCREVITKAYRKLGAVGRKANLDATDSATGLSNLQSMFEAWISGGMFGRLWDVYSATDVTAKVGQRIRTTAVVTLPTFTDENGWGSYCCGGWDYGFYHDECNYTLNHAVIVVVNPTTGVQQINMWDSTTGQWVRLDALELGDPCPLSNLGVDDLACCLAKTLADEAGFTVGPQTERRAGMFEMRLAMRPDSNQRIARGEYM